MVTRVPMARLGEHDYRTYLNGVRVGGFFVAPSYEDVPEELERAAYQALAAAMPEVAIEPVQADEMIRLGGALHCTTLGLSYRTAMHASK